MFGLGMGELLIILVIVIIVFGSTRLPMIGQGLGRGIQNFKKEVKDLKKKKANNEDNDVTDKKEEDDENEIINGDTKK